VEAETCKKELVIEIPVDVLRKESENVTAQYQRTARIPGFRRGHAPATLVRQHFRDAIRKQVVQSLVPKFFERAVTEQKLAVVGEPRFEDLKFDDEQPLTCKAMFEVLPEFELGDYKNLEAEEDPGTVTEADVDQALEELRQGAATYEVVEDRPADNDDYVLVNYQGRDVKEPSAPPLEAHDAVVHLGGKGTVAAFSANLRGAKSGEVREFDVAYPDDYPQKSLAGKTFRYRVEVQSIKKKVVPAADDELAKSVSESETLADLRAKLRAELATRRKKQAEKATMSKLLEQLVNRRPFPVPEALVEAQLDHKIESVVTQLVAQRIDPRSTEIDWRKLREESRPEAEKEVRGSLILEKVAAAEGIEVTEEEVDEMVRATAQERHEPPAALKTRLTREGVLDKIRFSRRNQKALELIYRNAKIIRKSEGTSSAG
jgi:trigger factor